jgi:hypothetical protein
LRWLAVALAIAIIAIPVICSAKTGIVAGLRSDNWHRFAAIGVIKPMSDHVATFAGLDAGGGQTVGQVHAIIRYQFDEYLEIGFILGPQITVHQPDLTDSEKISYLAATTGVSLTYHLNDQISFWLAGEYANDNADLSNANMGLGVILWSQ